MKILDLQLTHFGKFHGRHVVFEPGLNIVYGKNEAGKSTIHTFIHGMLFGLDRMKKSALQQMDPYERYEPWDKQGGYEGSLRFEEDDIVYRIERSFLKDNKYLRLYDETNNTEIDNAQEELTRILGNLTEVTFANTISIGQMRSNTDAELQDELRNYVANLGSTQNKDIDLAETEANLKAEEKRLEASINYEAEARLQSLKDEHNQMLAEINAITEDKASKESERQEIQDHLDEVLYDVENATAEHDKKIREMDSAIAKEVAWLQETSKGSPITMKDRIIVIVFWALAFILALFAIVMLFSDLTLAIFALVIALILFGVGIYTNIMNTKSAMKYDEFMQRQSTLLAKTDELENLKSGWVPPNPEEVTELQNKISEVDNLIRQHTWEIELKQEVMIRIESDIAHTEEICASNDSAKQELEAVHEAMETLHKMSAEIHDTFGDKLNEFASEYFAKITEGKYTKVVVDESFNITLRTQEDRVVPLDQLSRGTIEQVYLSVRLAAAKLLWEKKPMPIMLDDVFAFYDEMRLASALSLLKNLDCQVLLFTCHKREQNIIDQQN